MASGRGGGPVVVAGVATRRGGRADSRGIPRRAADTVERPQLHSGTGAGADDPEAWWQEEAPPGDRDRGRPGGPGVVEAGVGADFRGGFPPVQLRVPPEPQDS